MSYIKKWFPLSFRNDKKLPLVILAYLLLAIFVGYALLGLLSHLLLTGWLFGILQVFVFFYSVAGILFAIFHNAGIC